VRGGGRLGRESAGVVVSGSAGAVVQHIYFAGVMCQCQSPKDHDAEAPSALSLYLHCAFFSSPPTILRAHHLTSIWTPGSVMMKSSRHLTRPPG